MEKEQIISLRKKTQCSPQENPLGGRLQLGPVADKCFTIAALGSIFGILYLGIQLWLTRSGSIEVPPNYVSLRHLHLFQQLFYFFGLPILGFAVQSAPRFLNFERQIPPLVRLSPIFLILAGWITFLFTGTSLPAKILTSAAFLILFLFNLRHMVLQKRFIPPLILLEISLYTFTVGPFLRLDDAATALVFFWFAIAGPLFGFSQIFISNLVGGRKIKRWEILTMLGLFIVSGSLALRAIYFPMPLLILFYIERTRCLPNSLAALGRCFRESIPLAFCVGYLWAFIGAVLLAVSPEHADSTLHIWAIGWGTSILISLTSHIIGFLSGHPASQRMLVPALLAWQFVALERGLGFVVGLPVILGHLTAIVSVYSLATWMYILCRAEYRILVRQWYVTPDEPMVQEA